MLARRHGRFGYWFGSGMGVAIGLACYLAPFGVVSLLDIKIPGVSGTVRLGKLAGVSIGVGILLVISGFLYVFINGYYNRRNRKLSEAEVALKRRENRAEVPMPGGSES